METLDLTINGERVEVQIEPGTTLQQLLHDTLGMTGTKEGCGAGLCGCCTVMVDDMAVKSCLILALQVRGRTVKTIEGLAQEEVLDPVQEAFIEHDASQCGYCTPGMVMTCAHLLDNNSNPTLEDVKNATRGNLCRCGTYPHVFKATLDAAKKLS